MTVQSLRLKIDRMIEHIEQQQEDIPDIAQRVAAWSSESLSRKLESFWSCYTSGVLDSEQYHALAQAIDQDIASRKTAAAAATGRVGLEHL